MSGARWSRGVDRAVLALAGVSGVAPAILWWGTIVLLGRPRFQDQRYVLVILVRPDWLSLGRQLPPTRCSWTSCTTTCRQFCWRFSPSDSGGSWGETGPPS